MSTSVPDLLIVRSRRLAVKATVPSLAVFATSYLAPGAGRTERRTCDASLVLDEPGQRFGHRLVCRGASHNPRPLAPCSPVALGRIGGAPEDRGEGIFPIRDF